jgi:hypothetical protein
MEHKEVPQTQELKLKPTLGLPGNLDPMGYQSLLDKLQLGNQVKLNKEMVKTLPLLIREALISPLTTRPLPRVLLRKTTGSLDSRTVHPVDPVMPVPFLSPLLTLFSMDHPMPNPLSLS